MKQHLNPTTVEALKKELLSAKRLLDIVLADEPESELSDYYPEWREYVDEIRGQISDLKAAIQYATMPISA